MTAAVPASPQIRPDRTGGPRIGLIVNPIAGMGGAVALHGTDGPWRLEEALRRGARAVAPTRAARAVGILAERAPGCTVLAFDGEMGADIGRRFGLPTEVVGAQAGSSTVAQDTRRAAREIARCRVDLILFAGGDGTARDIYDTVGNRLPLLGIPAGVKMHSAVFGTSPDAAGILASDVVTSHPRLEMRDVEIMDADEDHENEGRRSGRLFGFARSPWRPNLLQHPKAGRPGDHEGALEALAREIASRMEPGRLYLVGPGTTTRSIITAMGLTSSLLGIDAVQDGELIGRDLREGELLALLDGRPATAFLGIVGGQGYIFGRGNQALSPDVIRRIGGENIVLVASAGKLLGLPDQRLLVDTGDVDLDLDLSGYRRVRTGPGTAIVMRVAA